MKFILLLGDYRNKHVEIIIIHEGYILQNYEIFLGFLKKTHVFILILVARLISKNVFIKTLLERFKNV